MCHCHFVIVPLESASPFSCHSLKQNQNTTEGGQRFFHREPFQFLCWVATADIILHWQCFKWHFIHTILPLWLWYSCLLVVSVNCTQIKVSVLTRGSLEASFLHQPSEGASSKKAVACWYSSLCQMNIYPLHSHTVRRNCTLKMGMEPQRFYHFPGLWQRRYI